MMELLGKLQCPVTGVPLHLSPDGTHEEADQVRYSTVDGVWQLLPNEFASHRITNYFEHYETDAEVFDYFESSGNQATLHEHRRLQETIIREIPGQATSILDVGCGNAWLAASIIQNRKRAEICSMDLSTANTQNAKKRVHDERHLVIRGDAQHLPFQDNTFDVIVASEVLEHIEEVAKFLQELFRALKPGGRLILTTPYNEVIQYSLCIHCNQKTPLHAHLHSVNEKFIQDQVQESGIHGKVSTQAFLNKLLVMLKGHVVLKYLPYLLWKGADLLANKVIGHQSRLLVTIDKIPRESF